MTDNLSQAGQNYPSKGTDHAPNGEVLDNANSRMSRRGPLVRVVSESAAAVDVVMISAMALIAESLYSGLVIQIPIDLLRTLGVGLVACAATVSMFAYLGLYRSEAVLRPRRAEIRKIVLGWFLVIFGLIVVGFLTKTSEDFSRGWAIVWALNSPWLVIVGRYGVQLLANRIIGQGKLARHVAIYGTGPVADRLALHLCNRTPEIVLVGIFDDRSADRNEEAGTISAIGTTTDLLMWGQQNPLDEVIVTVPMNARQRVDQILSTLTALPVDIRICPGMPVVEGVVPRISYLDDMPLITVLDRPISEWSWMAKTSFDRVVATLMLVLATPLMLAIAAAVRLESRGPALFRQRRHGFNHEIITVLKFRTMSVMEDGSTLKQATKGDKRITRLGALLRSTSLDELPQLINVLRGDMSLVGPRPHALAHNEHFAKIFGHYANRHRVKPGITGLAQVKGLRGETETDEKMAARIKYDLYYIENWSILLDLWILLLTLFVVPFQKEAR